MKEAQLEIRTVQRGAQAGLHAQILAILQQAERGEQTIETICRKHNVSENTFYRWRSRFGKAAPGDATKSRELASENARLKRLLAERDLENDILKELLANRTFAFCLLDRRLVLGHTR